MVLATAVPLRTPTAFSRVAMMTAFRGESTRVETTVAIALGASVAPFTNSAARTRNRTRMRPKVSISVEAVARSRKPEAGRRRPLATSGFEAPGLLLLSSTVLQHDPLERVPHVLAPVDGVLDVVVDFLPLHD